MKFTLENAELLSKPEFCTAKEAIDFAVKVLTSVLKRPDILARKDIKEYLSFFSEIKEKPIIKKEEGFKPSSQVPYGCNW